MDIRVKRAIERKKMAQRAFEIAMQTAYAPGMPIEWALFNAGCKPVSYRGTVRRLGFGMDRILVVNDLTGRERWITIGSVV
jgi:hypothetical protein